MCPRQLLETICVKGEVQQYEIEINMHSKKCLVCIGCSSDYKPEIELVKFDRDTRN